MSERTALVTGCAGYIGTVLCQELLYAGFNVLGVDTLAYNQETSILHLVGHKNFEFHWQDARNMEDLKPLMKQADVIFPLAALVGAPACEKNPTYAESLNVEAISGLVKLASPYQRIIYPNTTSGYGQTDGESEVTEESPMNPVSLYGRTKCEGEKLVLDHPRSAVLRLATVFGVSPRMRFDLLVNDFVCQVINKKEVTVFEPYFKRNFLHIRDAARAFHFMANDQRHRGVYNVGHPDYNLTKLELAHTICHFLEREKECVRIGVGEDPDQRNYIVSNQKLLNTGFTFKHGLDLGIYDVANVARMMSPPKLERMRNA